MQVLQGRLIFLGSNSVALSERGLVTTMSSSWRRFTPASCRQELCTLVKSPHSYLPCKLRAVTARQEQKEVCVCVGRIILRPTALRPLSD